MLLRLYLTRRGLSTAVKDKLTINEKVFDSDNFTNIRPKILELMKRKLYLNEEHPLSLIRQRIVHYFHQNFKGRTGNSIFSVYDQLDPIVTTYQNFDSLLVPENHDSRCKTNCYYINKDTLLRAHMTAHQNELIKSGLNNFLMVGDVYRRDAIDSCHYPAFHQLDGVRLFTPEELLAVEDDGSKKLQIKRDGNGERCETCQEFYTAEASLKVINNLKHSLEGLIKQLFKGTDFRWVDAYFPFTHPSLELEIFHGGKWIEVLGCGIIEHRILKEAGCEDRIGWAFGLGLERLAMILYSIPDIRIFWSKDTGFLHQFSGLSFMDNVVYKAISIFPQCTNHISFWIPEHFSSNDFYDLVRDVAGEWVEQINLIDVYKKPDTGKTSHCYQIVYRHPAKTFKQAEVNEIHNKISLTAAEALKVVIR